MRSGKLNVCGQVPINKTFQGIVAFSLNTSLMIYKQPDLQSTHLLVSWFIADPVLLLVHKSQGWKVPQESFNPTPAQMQDELFINHPRQMFY